MRPVCRRQHEATGPAADRDNQLLTLYACTPIALALVMQLRYPDFDWILMFDIRILEKFDINIPSIYLICYK